MGERRVGLPRAFPVSSHRLLRKTHVSSKARLPRKMMTTISIFNILVMVFDDLREPVEHGNFSGAQQVLFGISNRTSKPESGGVFT